MKTKGRRWYLTAIAFIYLVLCTQACIYYVSLHFRSDGASVPASVQLLALGMAISAGLYFFNASLGHRGLLILTVVTLVVMGTSDPRATIFHLFVLFVLSIPFLRRQTQHKDSANHGVQAISDSTAIGGIRNA